MILGLEGKQLTMPPVSAELAFQDHQNQERILWCVLSFASPAFIM